jgi:tRNA modification GTPase
VSQNIGNQDTICAPASPSGRGAVSALRISGPKAYSLLAELFQGRSPSLTPRRALYGFIQDHERTYDEVIAIYYPGPRSYTAEDMVEIFCHGNPVIVRDILDLLVRHGARPAEPGEFTERAFANGRIDLTQAEAVDSLIRAHGSQEYRIWLKQAGGVFRRTIEAMRGELIELTADIEAEIDFDEGHVFAPYQRKVELVQSILQRIQKILEHGRLGQKISHGFDIALVGKPNVGKSSLMNLLLNQERAIVSQTPGTTRDVISEELEIQGLSFRFHDTAGIRDLDSAHGQNSPAPAPFEHGHEAIEAQGIQRSKETLQKAHLALLLFDAASPFGAQDQSLLDFARDQGTELLFVFNKVDLIEPHTQEKWREFLPDKPLVFLSATQGTGLAELEQALTKQLRIPSFGEDDTLILHQRVQNHLQNIQESLEEFLHLARLEQPQEIQAHALRQALDEMGAITGGIHTEDILGSIFGRFCIGK